MEKRSTRRSKARPLPAGTWPCHVGARKLPHEENNDGRMVSRLPSPYNKIQLNMCLVFCSSLSLWSNYPLA